MNWVARTVDRLDEIGPRWLLLPNVCFAVFILLAHGGALFLARIGRGAELAGAGEYLYISIALAVIALATALLAWVLPRSLLWVLKLHSLLLVALAVYILQFALSVVAFGVPRGNFTWNPALFAVVVAYPVYLARRVLLPPSALRLSILRYGHVVVALLSFLISAGVFWRLSTWSPSASDFDHGVVRENEMTPVPLAQVEPLVPESSGDSTSSGDIVTLLSTSFESAQRDEKGAGPFVQQGELPWGRDIRAHSGQAAINAIPHGNPGDLRYFNKSVSPVLLNSHLSGGYAPFRVDSFRRVQLEFWRFSTSNPSETHNCLGSLRVEYRIDQGPWESKMVFCGWHKSKAREWKRSVLEFDTAGHSTLELRFDYEYPPDSRRDANAAYLVDDLSVRGYRRDP
jgi:hypothetical protein